MKASSTAAAIASRHRATEAKINNVRGVVRRMLKSREPINFRTVADAAGVSRTFLYDNPTARSVVTQAIDTVGGRRHRHNGPTPTLAAWRERALNAEHTLQLATEEIHAQREQLGRLLGRVRELASSLLPDAAQRIYADNLDLRLEIQQLTAGNEQLTQKLKAARENNRFQDRRIAELEALVLGAKASPPTAYS